MTATIPMPHPAMTQQGFFRLSVADYHEMGERGILGPEDRVELLDGYLVVKPMQNSPHSSAVQYLVKRLLRRLPAGWDLRPQLPVTLVQSEPEPDGAIVRGDETTYRNHQPRPADIGFLVEVSDSTLHLDREAKSVIYAQDAIAQYWIVNLVHAQVEVYSEPDSIARRYRVETIYRLGDVVPIVLDGVEVGRIAVSDLLP